MPREIVIDAKQLGDLFQGIAQRLEDGLRAADAASIREAKKYAERRGEQVAPIFRRPKRKAGGSPLGWKVEGPSEKGRDLESRLFSFTLNDQQAYEGPKVSSGEIAQAIEGSVRDRRLEAVKKAIGL